jgi:sugar phosphate permease
MYFVYFCMTWMPAYFMERRHLSLSQMGLYTFFSFGGMAIVAAVAGWAADLVIGRGGNPVTVRKWFTIAGFVVACTELIGAQSSSVTVALTFSVVSLSGLGLATANYWALTQTLIPASAIGRVSGVQNCAASIAGIVAPILTGWLKQKTGSYEAPMLACCVFLVIGVLSYVFMVKERYAPEAALWCLGWALPKRPASGAGRGGLRRNWWTRCPNRSAAARCGRAISCRRNRQSWRSTE